MEKTYEQENKELISNFIKRTFVSATTQDYGSEVFLGNYRTIELILNPACDLNCKYCYFVKHQKDYFTKPSLKKANILENTKLLLDWIAGNNMNVRLELFGGDPIMNGIAFDVLNIIYSHIKKGLKVEMITIPTNGSFVEYDDKINKIFDFKQLAIDLGTYLFLSISVDGVFMDKANRPKRKGERSIDFYHKLFSFASKYGSGFHPMIYSNNIEFWPENFLWFQHMFSKYGIPWDSIYLLEVRNPEWSKKQIIDFASFVEFLIDWVVYKIGKDNLVDFVTRGRGFNILANPFNTIGRGIGCSIQSTIGVRVGDLTVYPCHRLMYPGMEAFRFKKIEDNILDIEPGNLELFFTIASIDHREFPICELCPFRELCSGGCLGAQYEATGDPFTPIPTVCLVEQVKVLSIISKYEDIGVLDKFLSVVSYRKKNAILELIKGGYIETYRNIKQNAKFH